MEVKTVRNYDSKEASINATYFTIEMSKQHKTIVVQYNQAQVRVPASV